ncbi:MAG: metallophosphoesterase [Planctomycetota bacterium]
MHDDAPYENHSRLDLADAEQVIYAFRAGAEATRGAACRRGSIEVISPPGTLVATGDLHDHPVHYQRLIEIAGLDPDRPDEIIDSPAPVHVMFQEIIHSDRLLQGCDLSYRALARIAAVKAVEPERVHVLLANHELAQLNHAAIVKNGVRMVEAFEAGLEYVFGAGAGEVELAIEDFISAMPLALRAETATGDILCAHSMPGVGAMGLFDPSVLERELSDADRAPRTGSAHLMVWGRGYDHDQLEDLVERWGVNLFILGHEHIDRGVHLFPPNAVILNSDHDRGVYLPIDLSDPPSLNEYPARAIPFRRDGF